MHYSFDPSAHRQQLVAIIREVEALYPEPPPKDLDSGRGRALKVKTLHQILRRHARDQRGFFSRSQLIAGFRAFCREEGFRLSEKQFIERLQMRPVRTQSGLAPVTVFTKPYACPGKCLYCPNETGAPKSYLPDEPGVQRAIENRFDPYLQTWNRLSALRAIGHLVDKTELIISGGTWSYYPESYQVWFIARCFDAMNDFGTKCDDRGACSLHGDPSTRSSSPSAETASGWGALANSHSQNEQTKCRCVGLAIETRPDYVTAPEIVRLRRLGATKVQLGCQSLSDEVLISNRRGHDVNATRRAMALLRGAGFKVLLHWMPNLLGATSQSDYDDFKRLFVDPDFCPDELKVYPCCAVKSADLADEFRNGRWHPYSEAQLLEMIKFALINAPRYCRISRVIRDISSADIVAGNRMSNLREVADRALRAEGKRPQEIRSREIGRFSFNPDTLKLGETAYHSSVGDEWFIELATPDDKLVGFIRLTLPQCQSAIAELDGSALIRELRVYGAALALGSRDQAKPQHQGLGQLLLATALERARAAGFARAAVISSVGTRAYYRRLGFYDGELYQHIHLDTREHDFHARYSCER
jgi:elongator complex protein 3